MNLRLLYAVMSSADTSEIKAPKELKDKKRRRTVKTEARSCPESKKWRASATAAGGGDGSKPVSLAQCVICEC